MSLEPPKEGEKIGHFTRIFFHRRGNLTYDVDIKLSGSQCDELKKRLENALQESGYKKVYTLGPLFQIPSIDKAYSVIVGTYGVSVYPPEDKYRLKKGELPEFMKFKEEIEKVLKEYPLK
jgi:hypothetical protein